MSIIPVNALFAIDSSGVVPAIQANSSAVVFAVNIYRERPGGDFVIIDTFVGVSMAVAWFADVRVFRKRRFPCFLLESWATLITRVSASVVSALTDHFISVTFRYAFIGMSVALTTATDGDVFDRVIVSSGNC